MTLNKRVLRDLKSGAIKYIALFIFLMVGLGVLAGMASSVDSILNTNDKYFKESNIEDGSFSLIVPLSKAKKKELSDEGVKLEETFFTDLDVADQSELRIFKERSNIDKVKIISGKEAENDDEIVLEKLYAKENGYAVGDTISVEGKVYTVTGTGTIPDYSFLLKNITDTAKNVNRFSVAFVTEDEFDRIKESNALDYYYAFKLKGKMDADDLKDELIDLPSNVPETTNLKTFVEKDDNTRITNYAEDAKINRATAFVVGIFFMLLVAYILSVFAAENIEKERTVIGTLYALGYKKSEVGRSFITLPLLVVLAGSICGCLVGYQLIDALAKENVVAFSYPNLEKSYEPYIIIFTIVAPLLFALVVNAIVINKRLSKEPLTLLRKQEGKSKISHVDLGNMKFMRRFVTRQCLRESGSIITLFAGLFLAILIMVMGFTVKGSIDYYIDKAVSDTDYEYMYLLNYPPEKVPAKAETAYTKELKIDYAATGGTADVSLQGIQSDSKYFDVELPDEKDQVYISSSAHEKMGLKKGDKLYLTDPITDESYGFEVAGTIEYANGMFMFMDIDAMTDRFGHENGYYNTCFSDEKLHISEKHINTVISRKDIKDASVQFIDLMSGTIYMLIGLSIMVLVITMYLLINLMIERSAFSISLVKVLGYQPKAVRDIYLAPGAITVVLATIISIPASKYIMNHIFPWLITNFAAGLKVYVSPIMYVQMVVLIWASYLIISIFLKKHLDRVSLTETLKNVE